MRPRISGRRPGRDRTAQTTGRQATDHLKKNQASGPAEHSEETVKDRPEDFPDQAGTTEGRDMTAAGAEYREKDGITVAAPEGTGNSTGTGNQASREAMTHIAPTEDTAAMTGSARTDSAKTDSAKTGSVRTGSARTATGLLPVGNVPPGVPADSSTASARNVPAWR